MSVGPANRRLDDVAFELLRLTALTLLLAVIVVPFVYVFSVSFRAPAEFFTQDVYLIPKEPTLQPWHESFRVLAEPLKNSLLIASGTMVIALIITIPGAVNAEINSPMSAADVPNGSMSVSHRSAVIQPPASSRRSTVRLVTAATSVIAETGAVR